MSGELLWRIAETFASLSLVAIGGANAVIPEIHRQVVEVQGWMNDAAFANLFAIAQAAPGPNVLVVSLIGWRVAGLAGLAVATVAMILPASLLAFAAGRLFTRFARAGWLRQVQAGLVPIAVGLILASGVVMGRAADHGPMTAAITVGTALFVFLSNRNPLWALGAGTLASILGLAAGGLG
ncbi:MAG TPA: chromate transporter [Candidatus Sulfotelmatobacter sp.]|nr:chromate transporter [Candidatus Sulfotelmatobacter sp.]